ncbi:hypothetical protein HMPREF1127_0448 [Fusobacterium necrophorum subsp. funduliforme Fnf 1007]|uniref:Uncharacterized protein n=1 Tax=Fusobacterium necrophorum subsp. funduliforme Fnf 1007 TaxID=1161424 RepID=A0AAN4ASC5_9FUSO|nr:hypothetical protein HMPREF1127_0448 [Fusobacterium necrophorum subsp. funduliforme Fnf 1007]
MRIFKIEKNLTFFRKREKYLTTGRRSHQEFYTGNFVHIHLTKKIIYPIISLVEISRK